MVLRVIVVGLADSQSACVVDIQVSFTKINAELGRERQGILALVGVRQSVITSTSVSLGYQQAASNYNYKSIRTNLHQAT